MSNLKRRAKSADSSAAETAAPQTAPEAPAKQEAAASTRKLASRRVDPNLMREAFANFQAARGSKTPFVKLTKADNRLRILGPKDPEVDPLPFLFHKVHGWRVQGRNYEAVDLDWLFNTPAMTERALKAGKIKPGDFERWQRFGGDPWNIAGNRARDLGLGGKDSKAPYLFGSAKWAYNVINRADSNVYVWVVGKQKQDALNAIYTEADIFDEEMGHDINAKGNGEDGNQRRYTISVVVKPSPAGEFDPEKMTDLQEYVIRRVKSWDAKVLALFGAYGAFVQGTLGFTPQDFGVNASTVSEAAASGKAPWEDEESEGGDE